MKILFINPRQFGYYSKFYQFSKHLSKTHEIDYISRYQGFTRVPSNNVKVDYVEENHLNWRVSFLIKFIKTDLKKYDAIMISYFKFVFIYKLFRLPKMTILDIDTGDLAGNEIKRKLWNTLILFESIFFNKITILSKSLLKELKLNVKKCKLLPLGADAFSTRSKKFEHHRLLYVGTFFKRNIHETVKAVALYKKKYPERKISYNIIGFGTSQDEQKIKTEILKSNLTDSIKLIGRVNHPNLEPYFEEANVGLVYVPITKYFNCQPSTKFYEYALSGLVSIATSTYENELTNNNDIGILCKDNPESLCSAIEFYYKNRKNYCSDTIKNSLSDHSWKYIIKKNLLPILEGSKY